MTENYRHYVDPFIGVDNPGFCLPGPYLPFSIIRLGPDTLAPQRSNGYSSASPIIRFSHTHVSGTGGGGRYGNIGVTPFTGHPRFAFDGYEREQEKAESGYYSVVLNPAGIRAELTVTPRVGLHRYTFPKGENANLLIDAGSVIQVGGDSPGENTGCSIGGYVEFISETELVGRGDFRGGWGHQFPYSVYFYAQLDCPATGRMVKNSQGIYPKLVVDGPNSMAVASFGNQEEINLRVGISYVSVANARASVVRETDGKTFEEILESARTIWDRALGRIRVEGGAFEERQLFYTLFSRLICMPSDLGIDDENPLWKSGVRHFTDLYALWDSVRNANSLLALIDPEFHTDLLNCLLDIADHIGWIPDAWIQGHSAMIQGGSSADILMCEAALKGLPGVDYSKALEKMRKNNELESPDPWLYGRHLRDYRDLGYLSTNVKKNSVSRHMEYAYQDWCIGTLADLLGERDLAERNWNSSLKIWNLWNDEIKFFAPKNPDGNWVQPFDPAYCLPDCWNDPYFYEGTSWQWSFNVQHDFAGLIKRHGGADAFVVHLDRFFDERHFYPKETMLHVPYLYIYAGRPDKTAERLRSIIAEHFRTNRNGLPDNEDMGCQSSFYMNSAMGFYPIMGQDLYLLSTPFFDKTVLELGQPDLCFIIEAPGASPERKYIASATLNGKPLDRAWLRHKEISGGAVIRYELSDHPTDWGMLDLPPSAIYERGSH